MLTEFQKYKSFDLFNRFFDHLSSSLNTHTKFRRAIFTCLRNISSLLFSFFLYKIILVHSPKSRLFLSSQPLKHVLAASNVPVRFVPRRTIQIDTVKNGIGSTHRPRPAQTPRIEYWWSPSVALCALRWCTALGQWADALWDGHTWCLMSAVEALKNVGAWKGWLLSIRRSIAMLRVVLLRMAVQFSRGRTGSLEKREGFKKFKNGYLQII